MTAIRNTGEDASTGTAPLASLLERVGLAGDEVARLVAGAPEPGTGYEAAAAATSRILAGASRLLARLPAPSARSTSERAAAEAIARASSAVREEFLAAHAAALYDALTDGRRRFLRVEALVEEAGRRLPGLVPSTAEMSVERRRPLAEKEGYARAHGELLGAFLSLPAAGTHLVEAMLRPGDEALGLLPEFRAHGELALGPITLRRHGRAGIVEQRNTRYLNAEDASTLGGFERAVDLVLLDESIEIGVLRGGPVGRPGYANGRVFGSGLNLTQLYLGQIDYLFFMERDLGFVHKIYRGLLGVERPGLRRDGAVEKLWLAAVESYAVGGAAQLLHVVDHVLAARGARLFLPARKEGIIPGASNLRLPRFVGDRAARQAILSGREWAAGEPDADALCDEVVDADELEAALEARVAAITDSGLVNAAANRRALREGEEPLEVFRSYMAGFARDMADCYLSPALVHNLERHWTTRGRDR